MRLIPLLALVLVSAMWGSHAVVGKAIETQMPAMSLTLWRFTLGALCYLPWSRRLRGMFRESRRHVPQLILTALCSCVVYPLLYYQSLRFLTPVESLLLINTAPFFAALFSRIFLGELVSGWGWAGIGVAFAGVTVIVGGNITGHFSILGILLALAASAAFAGYTVSSRSLFQKLPLLDVLLATSVIGAVLLWLIVPFVENLHEVLSAALRLTGFGWMELIYIVLVVGTIAYAVYGFGLKRVPSGIASAITFYPQAVFAALIQWLWFGLVPSPLMFVSAALIFSGTGMMRYGEKRLRNSRLNPGMENFPRDGETENVR